MLPCFQACCFFGQKYFEGESEGMLPRKFFENLHNVVTILVLFEQFSGKSCSNFLPLNLSVSPNIMHFELDEKFARDKLMFRL